MKWNESGFRPPLCTYRLNWARRTSWGWWDDWNDTVLQTQDSKFEPWRSEAEHATSRSRRLPTILTFTRGWGRNIFVSFKPLRPGTEPQTLAQVDRRFIKIITHYDITHTTYSNLISVNDMIKELTFFGDCRGNRSWWQPCWQYPAFTMHWPNVALMFDQRRRRWLNVFRHCANASCLLRHEFGNAWHIGSNLLNIEQIRQGLTNQFNQRAYNTLFDDNVSPYCVGIDFSRQNLTSVDVRLWRLMSTPHCKSKHIYNVRRPIT